MLREKQIYHFTFKCNFGVNRDYNKLASDWHVKYTNHYKSIGYREDADVDTGVPYRADARVLSKIPSYGYIFLNVNRKSS